MGLQIVAFQNSIQYMSRYRVVSSFKSVFDLVYVWYMFSIKNDKKLNATENIWSDFTYSGIHIMYKNWYMNWSTAFFVVPLVYSIPEATRNE